MKINKKILSLPPYLSTTWEHIAAVRLDSTELLITTIQGENIRIPDLSPEILESILNHHLLFLEEREASPAFEKPEVHAAHRKHAAPEHVGESLFKFGIGSPENMSLAMHHNPELANAPDIPGEVIEKIRAISKILPAEDIVIPKAEPHCNCPYCQIARALHATTRESVSEILEEVIEEEIKEEDLRFQEWDIIQSGDKLFTVTNKLDSCEKYSVYLGHPVGCTCGKEGCEHILAVLKS